MTTSMTTPQLGGAHKRERSRKRPILLLATCIAVVASVGQVSGVASAAADQSYSGSDYVVVDNMSRVNSSGWGTASTGGDYTTESGAQYADDGDMSSMVLSAGGASASARLEAVSVKDQNARATFSTPALAKAGNGTYAGIRVRSVGLSSYLAQARVTTDGTVKISVVRVNRDGTTVTLATEAPVKGHGFLPRGGRETCPVTVTKTAR